MLGKKHSEATGCCFTFFRGIYGMYIDANMTRSSVDIS